MRTFNHDENHTGGHTSRCEAHSALRSCLAPQYDYSVDRDCTILHLGQRDTSASVPYMLSVVIAL
jgi:hypothetical protein